MASEEVSNEFLLEQIEDLQRNTDHFFLITYAMIIFLMQCGFAFLEAGAVRSKNTTNILIKNLLDCFVSALMYWALGFGFAFGPGNGFIGDQYFFLSRMPDGMMSKWFFQFVFAATSATIVSGGVAERCDFIAYLVYSMFLSGFAYPVMSHWAWSDSGWLTANRGIIYPGIGYQDFAGSGVIHLFGGLAALCGAVMVGPRLGRFDKITGEPKPIRGHSVALSCLGAFILFFGFFAFNGGSRLSVSKGNSGDIVSLAIVNTMISGSAAGITAIIGQKSIGACGVACDMCSATSWSLLITINGALTGMVAICAGADSVAPWGAFTIGVFAGFFYMFLSFVVLKFKVDDPLDAVAVHAGGGFLGVIMAPLLDQNKGAFLGHPDGAKTFLMNIIGILAISAWSISTMLSLFFLLKLMKVLRVSKDDEIKGLDLVKHEPAYPEDEPYIEDDEEEQIEMNGGYIIPQASASGTYYDNNATEYDDFSPQYTEGKPGQLGGGADVDASNYYGLTPKPHPA